MMFRLSWVLLLAMSCLAQTADNYRQRAIEFSRKKSWDEAIANYQHAIALNPNDASTHYNFALALKYKGDAQQAVQEFQAALRLKPTWGDAHYALGATLYDLQDLAAAPGDGRGVERGAAMPVQAMCPAGLRKPRSSRMCPVSVMSPPLWISVVKA